MEEFIGKIRMELVVSAITAMFTVGIPLLFRYIKNKCFEKKFKLSGNYLTSFEDEIDGEQIVEKAPCCISQKGKKIVGKTTLGERVWSLEGRITKEGYVVGIYQADDTHDKGVGNFFLEPNFQGDLVGLWSGYDSVNRKIVSGKYTFSKVKDISIREIRKKDIPRLIHIAEKQLGDSYIQIEEFRRKENIRLCAVVDGEVVGFCLARKLDHDFLSNLKSRLPVKHANKRLEILDEAGLVSSIAVDPAYVGRGVGTLMIEKSIHEIEQLGCNAILMTAWKGRRGVHIGDIATRCGFELVSEIENYWKDDSLKFNYKCPDCGDDSPPCLCSAVIFLRT